MGLVTHTICFITEITMEKVFAYWGKVVKYRTNDPSDSNSPQKGILLLKKSWVFWLIWFCFILLLLVYLN